MLVIDSEREEIVISWQPHLKFCDGCYLAVRPGHYANIKLQASSKTLIAGFCDPFVYAASHEHSESLKTPEIT